MKTREIKAHDVSVRFSIPEYEINLESNGRPEMIRRLRAGKLTEEQAFGEILANLFEEIGPTEGLVIDIDGETVIDEREEQGGAEVPR